MLVDDAPRRIVSHVYNLLAASGFRPARLSIACLLFRFTPAIRGSASRRRPYHAPASDLFNPGASGPRVFAAPRLQSAPSARGHIRRNRGVLPRRRSPVSGGRFPAAGRAHPPAVFFARPASAAGSRALATIRRLLHMRRVPPCAFIRRRLPAPGAPFPVQACAPDAKPPVPPRSFCLSPARAVPFRRDCAARAGRPASVQKQTKIQVGTPPAPFRRCCAKSPVKPHFQKILEIIMKKNYNILYGIRPN